MKLVKVDYIDGTSNKWFKDVDVNSAPNRIRLSDNRTWHKREKLEDQFMLTASKERRKEKKQLFYNKFKK